MARTEALVWSPAAAEVLVLTCAMALTCAGHSLRAESHDADTRQVGVPADDASDDDATDDEASGDEATDEGTSDDEAADANAAEPREDTADDRASDALHQAEKYEAEEQYLECAQAVAPITWQLSAVEDSDLADAVEKTYHRCDEALEKQYEAITVKDCPLEVEDAIAATAAPPRLVPKAAKAACLVLVPFSFKTQTPDERGIGCPRIALVWLAGGLHRRELPFDGGPLGDEGFCCNLESIAAGILDGKTLIRVDGAGHACGGGTAVEYTQALYEWNGKSLASPIDISIDFH